MQGRAFFWANGIRRRNGLAASARNSRNGDGLMPTFHCEMQCPPVGKHPQTRALSDCHSKLGAPYLPGANSRQAVQGCLASVFCESGAQKRSPAPAIPYL